MLGVGRLSSSYLLEAPIKAPIAPMAAPAARPIGIGISIGPPKVEPGEMKTPSSLLAPLLVASTLVASASACRNVQELPPEIGEVPDTLTLDATVEFLNIEFGCWALAVSSTARLEPLDLPDEFRVNGLKVRATVALAEVGSYCMIGPVVRLLEIHRR